MTVTLIARKNTAPTIPSLANMGRNNYLPPLPTSTLPFSLLAVIPTGVTVRLFFLSPGKFRVVKRALFNISNQLKLM
jgi:hypothetical protein